MRFGKSINIIVTSAAVCVLLAAALLTLKGPAKDGGDATGYLRQMPIVPTCCVLAAVGVILLGLRCLRLTGTIMSIAEIFSKERQDDAAKGAFSSLGTTNPDQLRKAVSEQLDAYDARIAEYERQIGESRLQIQLLQKRRQNAEAIVYSIRDAVIVVDESDRLLMANEAAGQLFNFDFRASQNKRLGDLLDADKKEFADFLSHSKRSKGRATKQELSFVENDEKKTFDCIVSCVYDEKKRICGAVAVLHDITREKEISQMKNDFVGHVSHELKTPLASITAYSEMLVDGEADDEETRKEFYSVIQNQARRLNRLIEDILNTSRIESGLMKINKEPISLAILIEEQLQMIRSYAEEKNIKVTGQKPIVFDQVNVDRDMMSQVIVNLLSNAVKYTPSGGSVKIGVKVDEVESLARVTVADTGVGIPEDEIGHVFDKFYRVGANNKQAKGTGLGLNLVKQIVEKLHDGRVFVESKVGVGSTFGFELPLATRRTAAVA